MRSKQRKTGVQQLFKVKDAAAMLGIARQRVVALIEDGTLHALNLAGNLENGRPVWRITKGSIDRFLTRKASETNSRRSKVASGIKNPPNTLQCAAPAKIIEDHKGVK